MGQVDIEMKCFLCGKVLDARRIGKRLLARCKCGVKYEPSDVEYLEAMQRWADRMAELKDR